MKTKARKKSSEKKHKSEFKLQFFKEEIRQLHLKLNRIGNIIHRKERSQPVPEKFVKEFKAKK